MRWQACRDVAYIALAAAAAVTAALLHQSIAAAIGIGGAWGATLGLLPAALPICVLSARFYQVRMRGLLAVDEARRVGRELAQQQLRAEVIVAATSVGIWDARADIDDIRVDERWAAMIGYCPEELMPLSRGRLNELIHPDDREGVTRALEQSLASAGLVFECDFRMRHKDGHWAWIAARGNAIERDRNSRPLRIVGTHTDISSRKGVELALMQGERKFRSLFELSPIGIMLNDADTGLFLQVNDALLAPTGYTREELLQLTYWDITLDSTEASDKAELQARGKNRYYGPIEKRYRRKDGSVYPGLLSAFCMTDEDGREVMWSIVQDISQRKAMESELSAAARSDRLTGLANRTLFMEQLQLAVERVHQGRQGHFAVLFLDFDHFKRVNDTMGHEAGDELLRQISVRLSEALCSESVTAVAGNANLVARFGGDEFLVLVNDLRSTDDAQLIADRLLASLAGTYSINGRDINSNASIGVVTSARSIDSAETILRNADVAMYEAKRTGRGCSVLFNDVMHTRLSRHVQLETDLRKAIAEQQFHLVYQPIRNLESGEIVSVEALLRWNHPQLGAISPAEFIPIAEESDLIVAIGDWVLREACRTMVAWQREMPLRAPRTISVNISRAELAMGPRLLEQVRRCLAGSGLAAPCLQLEVTEREVMRDPGAALAMMQALRALGVRLAMDDFGTGTSSLGCLREYPFDAIKIDRSFMSELSASQDGMAVIHATITLAQNLDRICIAEGIETATQAAIVQSMGCACGQGYYLGRPVLAEVLSEELAGCEPLPVKRAM